MTEPDESPRIEIVRGAPSDIELAALIAAVSDAYTVETADAVADVPRISVWERTQRGLQGPLRKDIPWGRFSG